MKRTIPILAFIFVVLMSCQNDKTETISGDHDTKKQTEQNNIALVKKMLIEGDNANPSFMDEITDPNYKYYLPSNNAPLSLPEHKQFWESVNQSFPDLTHSIKEIFAVDDKVVARLIVSGTHQGEFAGIPPSGTFVEVGQIIICQFKDGKLLELREEVDLLGLYQQLGMELKPKQ